MSANYKIFVPFILRWEGGVVNDKADSGGLTNKGITFTTYQALAKLVLKKEPSQTNFLKMTVTDAELIIKYFWDKSTYKNSIKSQKIAEAITSWMWGTGATGIKEFQRLLNEKYNAKLLVDGIMGSNTAAFVNSLNEHNLFIEMIKARKQFFIDLANQRPKDKKFLNGWLNRLQDFYDRHKRAEDPVLKLTKIVGLMVGTFFLVRLILNS